MDYLKLQINRFQNNETFIVNTILILYAINIKPVEKYKIENNEIIIEDYEIYKFINNEVI